MKAKTTRHLQVITTLKGSKWGLSLKELRLIFMSCIAPIALYAISVWHVPRMQGQMALHDKQVRALTVIQRHACKVISGGFCLVSGDTYNTKL